MTAPASPHDATGQGLELANATDITVVQVDGPRSQFIVHTSLLIQSSKWFEERLKDISGTPASASLAGSPRTTIRIPLPYTSAAVNIYVEYLYRKDVVPHEATFSKHGIDACYLSQFLQATDFQKCCERAVEHAINKRILEPSLVDLQRSSQCDLPNAIQKRISDNIVGRIMASKYEYVDDEDLIDGSTWKALCLAIAERARNVVRMTPHHESSAAKVDPSLAKTTSSNIVNNQGLFSNNQSLPKSSGGCFASSVLNEETSKRDIWGNPYNSGGFGQPSHNTSDTTRSLSGSSQTQAPQSTGLFDSTNSNTTGSLFGGPSHNNASTTGGLFNNSQPQTQQSNSLFGAPSNNNSSTAGGLFGRACNNSGASGGLLGNHQAQTQQPTSLFSAAPNGTTAAGGFSSNTRDQPQYSSGLFGTNPGLFGNIQKQPQQSTSLFGAPPSTTASGGLFGAASHNNAGTTGGLFGSRPNDPNTGGSLFGSNQAHGQQSTGLFGAGGFGTNQSQNRSFDGFGDRNVGGSAFGQVRAYSAFGANPNTTSNVFCGHYGPFNTPCTHAQPITVNTESSFGSARRDEKDPFKSFVEKEANGTISVYHHICFGEEHKCLSPEEVRLSDYNKGYQFGSYPRQHPPIPTSTGISRPFGENEPPKQSSNPFNKLNPPAFLERPSNQTTLQSTELGVLRTKLKRLEQNAMFSADALEGTFNEKFNVIQEQLKDLKIKQEEQNESILAKFASVVENILDNKHKEQVENHEHEHNNGESNMSTPINILTPTSTAASSPFPTAKITTTESDDFINIDSSTHSTSPENVTSSKEPTTTELNLEDQIWTRALQLSSNTRRVFAGLWEMSNPPHSPVIMDLELEMGLTTDDVAKVVEELVEKGLIHQDSENIYQWGPK